MSRIQAFPKTYTLTNFNEDEVSVKSSQFTTVWQMPVDKGMTESFGRGVKANQTDAEGRLYAQVKDDADSELAGQLRLAIRTKQGRLVSVINEFDLDEVDVGASDRTKRYPFPIQRFSTSDGDVHRWVAYPYVVTLEVKPDADATVSTSNSTLKLDGKRGEQVA